VGATLLVRWCLLPGVEALQTLQCGQLVRAAVTFIGKIGRDQMGMLAREELVREGVEHRFIETDAHVTGSVAVFVDHTGERSMVSGHGADFLFVAF
jgi:ribokinase